MRAAKDLKSHHATSCENTQGRIPPESFTKRKFDILVGVAGSRMPSSAGILRYCARSQRAKTKEEQTTNKSFSQPHGKSSDDARPARQF